MPETWINAVTVVILGFTFVFLFLSVLIGCIHLLSLLSPKLERFLQLQVKVNNKTPLPFTQNQSLKEKAIAAALAVHHQRMQS